MIGDRTAKDLAAEDLAAGARSATARAEPPAVPHTAGAEGSVAVLGELLGFRPASGRDAVTHLALPSATSPSFYVPVISRDAAVASCLAYNRLRPQPVARRRSAVGWGLRLGLVQRLRGTPMTSGAPTGRFVSTIDGDPLRPLLDELARCLGCGELSAATSPRPVDPFWTPTLQLFDRAGTPVGYAKVGWTDLTRTQVTSEADLLARLADHPVAGFASPAPIGRFTWGDTVVSVTAPMPPDVVRVTVDDGPFPRVLNDVAGLGGQLRETTFGSSGGAAWADRLVGEPGGMPIWAQTLFAKTWATARHRLGARPVLLGRWHGDWVPWNVARSGTQMWVWDWEYSGADRPVGLDAYHWYYQQARIVERSGVVAALDEARMRGARHLDALGVKSETEPVIAAAHVLELAARAVNAARMGAPGAERGLGDLSALCAVLGARADRTGAVR